jgi:hypothetical protein
MPNLYCDLAINGTPLWQGVPCLNRVQIGSFPYLGFIGTLAFADMQGSADPLYPGLDLKTGRYILLYYQDGQDTVQIPLQAIPAQQFDITLGGQNCTISIYQK